MLYFNFTLFCSVCKNSTSSWFSIACFGCTRFAFKKDGICSGVNHAKELRIGSSQNLAAYEVGSENVAGHEIKFNAETSSTIIVDSPFSS